MIKKRNEAFDITKGLLIILVIIGHVLLGNISENLARKIIYFFHMPIFLAITGFFIKSSLLKQKPTEILKKYNDRLLKPYFIAFVFYTILVIIKNNVGFKELVESILYPFYHLWYVPAVIIFIFYAKILESIPKICFYIMITAFTAAAIYFEGFGQNSSDNLIYKAIGDKRFYYFFIYFYVGYYLSSIKTAINNNIFIFFFLLSLLIYISESNGYILGLSKVSANICLIILLLTHLNNVTYKKSFLAKVGKVSLPIYLWHVLPVLILKKLELQEYIYYSLSMVVFCIFVYAMVVLEGKSSFIDQYIYGKRPKDE